MVKKIIAALALLGCASQSHALEVAFDLTDVDSRESVKMQTKCYWWFCRTSETNYAMVYNFSSGDDSLSMAASGWSYNSAGEIEADYIGNWDPYGLGIEVAGNPNHAIDNYNLDYDMMLLEFSEKVDLSSITSGWRSGGDSTSELSLLAYSGNTPDSSGFSGKQWEDLLSEGWASAGDAQIDRLNQAESVNSGGMTSKYWLVGAYNQNLGGTAGYTDGNDFFKIKSVGVSVSAVPVPGSMMLFGLSLLGFGAYRRRTAK